MNRRLTAALNPRSSLRARFTLLIGGSGLALALLAVLVTGHFQREQLTLLHGQAMQREAQLLGRTLAAALQQRLQQLHDTASQPLLASGLADPGEARLTLEALRSQQPALAWVAMLDTQGRVQVATNTLLEAQDLHAEAWFAPALRAGWVGQRRPAGALTGHLGLENGQAPQLIDLAVPLVDMQGRVTGVLAARLRWTWLDALYQDLQAGKGQATHPQSLVLDRAGRVLLGPADRLDQRLAVPGLDALRSGAPARVLHWPGEGDFVTSWAQAAPVVAVATAASADAVPAGPDDAGNARAPVLSVLLRQPVAQAFASADALRQRLLLMGVLATLVFMALSLWLADRVARPIRALSAAAMRVVQGQAPAFDAMAPSRRDEVAELARALPLLHAELSHRLAELQQTSRLAQVGGWTVDLRTQRGTWTEEMARIYQQPADLEPTAELALSYFQGEHRQRLGQALQRLLADGQPYDLELQLCLPSGQVKWVRACAEARLDSAGRAVQLAGITQDITERRAAQEAVRLLNAQLELRVAERTAELRAANAELDAFAYAVSHDLRAPLRAMSGFSQALVEDHGPQLPAEARQLLQQVVLGSQRMGELIDGLLALSRSVRGPLRDDDVDLSALAEHSIAQLRLAEPQRQVQAHIHPGLRARGDRRMLAAVLDNLLGNAWKYSAGNASARIEFKCLMQDGEAWFCVQDNGAGFDMAHAGRLFKVFSRLHRQDEFTGLGIGLATVQRIIARHGGRIEAQSAPGQGALFKFTLPARRAAVPVETPTP